MFAPETRAPIFTLDMNTTNRFLHKSQNPRAPETLKDVSPIEIKKVSGVSVNTHGSEKSNAGSAFNFDELISKRLKQRKRCRASVMNHIINNDVAVSGGGTGTYELFPTDSHNNLLPEYNTYRSKSGLGEVHGLLDSNRNLNHFLSLRNSRSEWKLPQIGSTKN